MPLGPEPPVPLSRQSCIERVPVFARLPASAREHLARELRHRHYAPGQLLTPGEEATHLTILAAGLARHTVTSPGGREQVLRFLGPGEFFGEMALFTGRPTPGEVRAVEPVEACILDGAALRRAVETWPELGWDLLRELARLLDETTRMAGSLATQSVDERVASLFLRLSGGAATFQIPFSRAETARLLGCARESLSRSLRRLQDLGLLQVDGRQVHLRDWEGLRALAGEEAPPRWRV